MHRGQSFRPRNSAHQCLGGGRCQIPNAEQLGNLNSEFDSATTIAVASALDLRGRLNIRFLTFGDDDLPDCAHSGLRLGLDIRNLAQFMTRRGLQNWRRQKPRRGFGVSPINLRVNRGMVFQLWP